MAERKLITLTEAGSLAPGEPCQSTLWRWARTGVKTAGGQRLFLRTYRAGRKLLTTASDLAKFFEDVAQADLEFFQTRAERNDRPRAAVQRPLEVRIENAERMAQSQGIL